MADFCCYHDWGIGIATINGVSMVINIIHLITIAAMESLKGLPYRWILIHITLADIGSALTLTAAYICLPGFVLISKLTPNTRPLSALIMWPQYMSYWIFLIASIERYYGICRPLLYSASTFTQRLSWILALTWLLNGSLTAVVVALNLLTLNNLTIYIQVSQIFFLGDRYVPLLVSAIPLFKIIKELIRMRGRSLAGEDTQIRRASVYLIIIYSLFIFFSMFDLVMSSIDIMYPDLIPFRAERLRNITKPLYGIINTVIYGLRSKAYRTQLRKMFCRENRVATTW